MNTLNTNHRGDEFTYLEILSQLDCLTSEYFMARFPFHLCLVNTLSDVYIFVESRYHLDVQ